MKYTAYTDNSLTLKGHVARLNPFGGGKAMNITVGVEDGGGGGSDLFVTVKCFSSNTFEILTIGMPIIIHGHVGSDSYVDKDGNVKYKGNNDLIADYIEFNETIKRSDIRRTTNALNQREKEAKEAKEKEKNKYSDY
jgi:single-stranded DNA-binding protein